MKSYDVTALGELLIDFTENGTSSQGNPVLEATPKTRPAIPRWQPIRAARRAMSLPC